MANNPVAFDAANPWLETYGYEVSENAPIAIEPPKNSTKIQLQDFVVGGNVIVPKYKTHERQMKFNSELTASVHNAQAVFLQNYMDWLKSQNNGG